MSFGCPKLLSGIRRIIAAVPLGVETGPGHLRIDGARRDGVDADVVIGELRGETGDHLPDCGLGHVVGGQVTRGAGRECAGGRDLDDGAAGGGRHDARGRQRHQERAPRVDGHHAIVELDVSLQEGAHRRDAGVVDEQVDSAELRCGGLDGARRIGGARDVTLDGHGGHAARLQLGHRRRDARAGQIDERQARPFVGERLGDGSADAARGPGDERRPPGKS